MAECDIAVNGGDGSATAGGIEQRRDPGIRPRDHEAGAAQQHPEPAGIVYTEPADRASLVPATELSTDNSTVVVQEDIREPERILAHPIVQQMLDFSQPVAVMCFAVLHFVTDEEDPWGIVSTLTESLVPGSYLALSHSSLDDTPAEISAAIQERYKTAAAPAVWRGREAIARFFTGLDLVEPGLVRFTDWRSDDLERKRPGGDCTWVLSGVARVP